MSKLLVRKKDRKVFPDGSSCSVITGDNTTGSISTF